MANETELERLVVRIVGDGSQYQQTLTKAAESTQAMSNRMVAALSRVERFASTLLGSLGSLGLAASLRGVFNQFADLETGQIKLRAAIEAGGHSADELVGRYVRVATAISQTTLQTKGSVLQLFRQAETMGISGDAAERMVRQSIALGEATDNEASSMLAVVKAMEMGNYQMLRRIRQLRGIKDETELVNAAHRLMESGQKQLEAVFNSAAGKMERLGRALKSVGTDIGGMVAGAILPLVSILQQAADQFKKLDEHTKRTVVTVTALAIAWLGMGPAIQVAKGLLGPVISLARWLLISLPLTVANAAAWVIWKGVLLLAATAVFMFTGFLWLFTGAVGASKVGIVLLSGVMLIWKGVIWLVNAALTVMNALLALATLLALVATVVTLGTVLLAVWSAVSAVVTVFRNLPDLAGPLGAVGQILGEWWMMLKKVYIIAQTDLPRAWQAMQAAASVAVSQVKDLFPPLWEFIKGGFSAAWDAVAELFVAKMINTAHRIANDPVMRIINPALGAAGLLIRPRDEQAPVDRMQARIQALINGFKVVESQATVAARKLFHSLVSPAAVKEAETAGMALGQAMNAGLHQEAPRFDAALVGSVEATARIEAYKDRTATNQVVAVLTQIRDILQNRPAVSFASSGLGNP